VGSLSVKRQFPLRPINSSWSRSSRQVVSPKPAIAASQPGLTTSLYASLPSAALDSVKVQSGFSISRRISQSPNSWSAVRVSTLMAAWQQFSM